MGKREQDELRENAPLGSPRFYYGWVNLAVAAFAMVATLPGRTHGLGLVTEPLLRDLQITKLQFGTINLWATLLGALFCIPVGRLIDRFGTRAVLTTVSLALGVVVMAMSGVAGALLLFVTITLTRGFGQSALSIVSLAIPGKWFGRRLSLAMGIYSVLMGIGFMVAFKTVGSSATHHWRATWFAIGLTLVAVLAPLAWLLVRSSPNAADENVAHEFRAQQASGSEGGSFTLWQALATQAFWVFALAECLYLLISSATSLFGEAILKEVGFDREVFITLSAVTPLIALTSNFVGGWLALRWSLARLMGVGMFSLTGALLLLPWVKTIVHVYLYAAAMGVAGGFATVIFFTIWARAFGRGHLGKITALAQMMTVLASAMGQLLPPLVERYANSYRPLFYSTAPLTLVFGLWAWWARVPSPADAAGNSTICHVPKLDEGELDYAGNAH